mgnify:CR=1 FL=1
MAKKNEGAYGPGDSGSPAPGYTPTEREAQDQRALLGSNIFYNPTLEMVELPMT